MSVRGMRKYGPRVHMYLKAGERLRDVQFVGALKSAPPMATPRADGPIVGTGATAAYLVNEMPARTSGVVCVTDARVFFCGTGFRTVKRMWWETPRENVVAVVSGSPVLFALQFADGSQTWFAGNRRDRDSIANALGQGATGSP